MVNWTGRTLWFRRSDRVSRSDQGKEKEREETAEQFVSREVDKSSESHSAQRLARTSSRCDIYGRESCRETPETAFGQRLTALSATDKDHHSPWIAYELYSSAFFPFIF
jgi:hypothetical protein